MHAHAIASYPVDTVEDTMENEQPEWILIKDAAAIMGLHIESVRRLCRQNKIRCRQLIKGVSVWEVSKEDAENYERDYGGRPHETDL